MVPEAQRHPRRAAKAALPDGATTATAVAIIPIVTAIISTAAVAESIPVDGGSGAARAIDISIEYERGAVGSQYNDPGQLDYESKLRSCGRSWSPGSTAIVIN